jgi:hypothetical protein
MTDFLFHKISEKERNEIRSEARKLMDSFSRKLVTVNNKRVVDSKKQTEFERAEKASSVADHQKRKDDNGDFSREIMFENAPRKNKDFIIAEKKGWE